MSVADILERLAANAGQASLRRRAIYGDLVAGAAAAPAQILADRDRQLQLTRQRAREDAQAGYARDAHDRADKDQARQDTDAARKEQERQDRGVIMAAGLDGSGPTPQWNYAPAVAKAVSLNRHDIARELIDAHSKAVHDARPKTPTELANDAADPNSPTQAQSTTALDLTRAPKPEPAPRAPGPIHDTPSGLVRVGDDNKATPIVGADGKPVKGYHPPPAAGGLSGLYGEIDAKAIAAQIRVGQHPPDIAQYGRPAAAAIASELAKKGPNGEAPFNLSRAEREWKAQLKLNATMNSGQQVRLDESIRSGLAMYDQVDALADKWDGLGIGPLSRTNLAAAKNGLKGKEAASIANQLSGQIGQLTSDIATIEQGGLTPTNESRAVAERSMQDWWGKGTIHDMTAQGRYNMQIRHTARNTQEPMTPGNGVDTRPAAPATPAAVPPPDLSGLAAGHGRTFTVGPYKGQTWTVGTDGQPRKVGG